MDQLCRSWLRILVSSLRTCTRVTDHTRTEKIGGDSIWFSWSSKSNGKPLWHSKKGFLYPKQTVSFCPLKDSRVNLGSVQPTRSPTRICGLTLDPRTQPDESVNQLVVDCWHFNQLWLVLFSRILIWKKSKKIQKKIPKNSEKYIKKEERKRPVTSIQVIPTLVRIRQFWTFGSYYHIPVSFFYY